MKVDYLPGRRNIGPREVRRRRRLGLMGAAASALLFLVLLWTDAPKPARALLAFPLLVATLGLVQASSET
ncbi:MAG TPA: hypothetical protein VJB88_13915 [Vicinamibacteria bacterium]|nr:hypothetical protein [Vicinamibacteria bacterium]